MVVTLGWYESLQKGHFLARVQSSLTQYLVLNTINNNYVIINSYRKKNKIIIFLLYPSDLKIIY